MRKLIAAAALVLFNSMALGQTGGMGPSTPAASPARPGHEAPVGHRQPRADQVPSEKNLSDPNDPVNREDALLDRKLKSICRGC
ncbi:MAG: hypothetical protein E7813_20345 [Bradyrhizobium sp.]|uniref:hypothetical protein n=1 Tax=Bradyrhizobium sp. TaxID=376 RepID=UPI0011FDF3E0|nr:hypothetical protein [Bradyrhizobium sp.]THD62527.1 MAG: hypothetical protein E7813_20345 [Bradyrhizobium sp.]